MNTSAFPEVLHREVAILQAQFPALAEALSRAQAILADGRLFVEESGREGMVLARDGHTYYHVNGACACKASAYRAEPCKHRLALRLYQRVSDAMRDEEERWEPDDATPAFQPPRPSPTIPAEALLMIQGRPFVKFEGLLQLAHERGLVELSTTVVSVTLDMAVCQAIARFQDGRTFTDIGDASPDNVAKHLRPNFVRMAATRASARALRCALNITHCARWRSLAPRRWRHDRDAELGSLTGPHSGASAGAPSTRVRCSCRSVHCALQRAKESVMQQSLWQMVPFPYDDLRESPPPCDLPGYFQETLEDVAGLAGGLAMATAHPECDERAVRCATTLLRKLTDALKWQIIGRAKGCRKPGLMAQPQSAKSPVCRS
jgi:hypothetical protein